MHEHTKKHNAVIKGSSNRTFGFVFTAFFSLIALYPIWIGGPIRTWAIGVACAIGLIAAIAPNLLGPANQIWMKFGLLLHAIVSPIALAILFFFVFFPTGLLMRLFGKDPLRLKFDSSAESYWINRDPPGPAPESMHQQF